MISPFSINVLPPATVFRDIVSRVQILASRAKTSLTRGLMPAPPEKTIYPDTWLLAYGAAVYRDEPIPAANAFAGGRSGFGPRAKTQCMICVTICAFASQV